MYRVFCDFDATVSLNDIWHRLFSLYGKPEAFTIWKEFGRGKMTAAECIRFACSTVENANVEEAIEVFRNEPLRPGFIEFVKVCKESGIPISIVSDGFTAYIRPMLEHYGIDIPYYTNNIELTPEGKLSIDFRYARESCRHCASCKCAHIMNGSADNDTIVYVGDGYSDVCPVQMSDVVFARDTLLTFCSKNGIPHHPFENFYQVESILKKYLRERPKYKRGPATHRRNELYMME